MICLMCGGPKKADKRAKFCVACRKAIARRRSQRWKEAHRERVLAENRAYAAAHKPIFRERKRRLRKAKPELFSRGYRRHRERHPEYHRERMRQWRADNPLKSREYANRRRDRRLAGGGITITAKQWTDLLAVYGHRCAYCARAGVPLDMDHIEPYALGGSGDVTNIAPACRQCNTSKHHRTIVVWLRRCGLPAWERAA